MLAHCEKSVCSNWSQKQSICLKNLSENYQMVNVNTNKKTYETDNMNRNIDNKHRPLGVFMC